MNKKENPQKPRGIGIFKNRKISARGEAGGQPGDGPKSGRQPGGVEIHECHAVRQAPDRAMSGPDMAEPAVTFLGIPFTMHRLYAVVEYIEWTHSDSLCTVQCLIVKLSGDPDSRMRSDSPMRKPGI